MSTFRSPAAAWLHDRGVPFREFVHDGPVLSLAQAAAERQQQPDQIIRSILFRVGKGQYALGLMAGPSQISWPALRRALGQSRVSMADREAVVRVTGAVPGAVGPFGLPDDIPLYIDRSVLGPHEISLGSGVRGTAIIMRPDDLLRALPAATVSDLCGDC